MEFKRLPPRVPTHIAEPTIESRSDELATQRHMLGFDDIPVDDEDLDDVRFRDILAAWGKQAISHSPLEKKLQSGVQKTRRLNELKKDLKWALMADLDETVRARSKRQPEPPRPQPQAISSHASVVHTPASAIHQAQPVPNTIDINISFGSMPKIPLDKLGRLKSSVLSFLWRTTKKQRMPAVAAVAIVVLALFFIPKPLQQQSTVVSRSGSTSRTTSNQPTYHVLLPDGKTTTDVGAFKRISPPGRDPAFAYTDTLRGVSIDVSQQPIPDSFKPNVDDKVAELAKNYGAADKITGSGSTTIYVGISSEGPQSAIFIKGGLLIQIKSAQEIQDTAWSWYADTLH